MTNKLSKLSKEEQIKTIERVILDIEKVKVTLGLCYFLSKALNCHGYYGHIKILMDGFNITNARRLSKKYKFQYPNGYSEGYWWDRNSNFDNVEKWFKPRIAFINALITELKN